MGIIPFIYLSTVVEGIIVRWVIIVTPTFCLHFFAPITTRFSPKLINIHEVTLARNLMGRDFPTDKVSCSKYTILLKKLHHTK